MATVSRVWDGNLCLEMERKLTIAWLHARGKLNIGGRINKLAELDPHGLVETVKASLGQVVEGAIALGTLVIPVEEIST